MQGVPCAGLPDSRQERRTPAQYTIIIMPDFLTSAEIAVTRAFVVTVPASVLTQSSEVKLKSDRLDAAAESGEWSLSAESHHRNGAAAAECESS